MVKNKTQKRITDEIAEIDALIKEIERVAGEKILSLRKTRYDLIRKMGAFK